MKISETAIVYTRVSTQEQAEHGTSLAHQAEACQRKAKELGLHVLGIFEEAGVSGGVFEARPQLQAALSLLAEKKAGVLICFNVSRLSRDVEHLAMIRKRIKGFAAKLVFCDIQYEDTASGKLSFYFNGMMAENERDTIRQRSVDGKMSRIADGYQPSRAMRPFGYHIVKKLDVLTGKYPQDMAGVYVILEDEAQWIREIFSRYASGASLFSIGRFMHDSGVPTMKGGKAWHPNTIACMIKNPVYKGEATYGKRQRLTDPTRLEKGMKRAAYSVKLPESEWKIIPCPAIVEAATWEACQVRFRENHERMSGNNRRRYALTGFVRCPNCGRTMGAKQTRVRNGPIGRYVHYHCKDYSERCYLTGVVCNPEHYNMAWLEERVYTCLTSLMEKPEIIRQALTAYRRAVAGENLEAEAERWSDELIALDRREKATVQAQIAGIEKGARADLYDAVFADIAKQRQLATEKLGALGERKKRLPSEAMTDTELMQSVLTDIQEALFAKEISPVERHAMLSTVLKSIVPRGKDIDITLRPWLQDDAQTVKLIVMRRSGKSKPVFLMALRTRSRDS